MKSNQTPICPQCSYVGNPSTATHCEICEQPLKHNSGLPNNLLNNLTRLFSNKWVVPLLLLALAVEGGYLIWNRQAVSTANSTPPPDAGCVAPESVKQDEQSAYSQICTAMQEVLNVPKGQFFYGGAMAAAAIRSQAVVDDITHAHPEFRLRYLDPFNVPPDSGMGIRMLINSELSFAESFRPLKEDEYSLAKSRGFILKQIPVAITGIAFYTHPSVNLPGLSFSQVQAIFAGKVTNWRQLGGPDLAIVPVIPDPDAKSTSFLLEGLPSQDRHFGRNLELVRDTTASVRKVAATLGGIGFGAQALVVGQQKVRLLGLAKGQSKNYVQPATPEGEVNKTVLRDGTYPLLRRLFVVVRQDGGLDELAGMAYANLLLSREGQQHVDQVGYLPIR